MSGDVVWWDGLGCDVMLHNVQYLMIQDCFTTATATTITAVLLVLLSLFVLVITIISIVIITHSCYCKCYCLFYYHREYSFRYYRPSMIFC